jgi:hypothetical protein
MDYFVDLCCCVVMGVLAVGFMALLFLIAYTVLYRMAVCA